MTPSTILGRALTGLLVIFPLTQIRAEEPAVFDLCKQQTPIRNQGARDSCPYFPPVAALEAAYGRKGIHVDLSVEHLIWLRNVTAGGDKNDRAVAENLVSTLGGGFGMGVLNHYAICRAQDLPYHGSGAAARIGGSNYYKGFGLEGYDWSKPFSQFLLNRWNFDPHQLPAAARANARYSIDKFVTFSRRDTKDPAKFEQVLASGHEIVFAINVHGNSDDSAIGQPVWRLKPGAKPDSVNHFMLMVGYDRNRKFFVVKNQWGPTNYTAMKTKLAPDWKDITRYNGFTLVDYNYLAACSEAHYITEVAPVPSSRFDTQRAIGQWQVEFKCKGKEIMTGVLCWRRLPNHDGQKTPDYRIGDLVTRDGQQYRVNARLDSHGGKHHELSMFIDFENGKIPLGSTHETTFKGTLELPETGDGALHVKGQPEPKSEIWGASAAEVELSAVQVSDRNLLKAIPVPK
jgi:hypothetical protein